MKLIAFLAAIGLTITGCTTGATIDGDWQLVTGERDGRPIPIVDNHPITLRVSGPELGGRSACNHYGAQVSYGGQSLLGETSVQVSEVSQTLMGCEPDVMDSEAAYLEALSRVDSTSRRGAQLVLSGPGVRLEFATLAD